MNKVIEKIITVGHVISHQNPEQFRQELLKFHAEFEVLQCVINTTAVMLNAQQGRGTMAIIPSAYIEFSCTEEQLKAFNTRQTLLLKK